MLKLIKNALSIFALSVVLLVISPMRAMEPAETEESCINLVKAAQAGNVGKIRGFWRIAAKIQLPHSMLQLMLGRKKLLLRLLTS